MFFRLFRVFRGLILTERDLTMLSSSPVRAALGKRMDRGFTHFTNR